MEDLKALFKVRDEHHQKYTLKIFNEIVTALGCVTAYLTDSDDIIAQGTITWEDVTFMEGVVVILGTVEYKVGDTLTFGIDEYIVTEENVDEFQQVVHMSLPFDLAQEGVEDKIMEHLYRAGEGKPIEEFSEIIIPPAATLDAEFDLSELSEEQIQALKLSTAKGGQ